MAEKTMVMAKDKISPFIMYPKMRYVKTQRKDCTDADIKEMLAMRTITETDDIVLKTLSKYGCMNSYLLRTYLYHMSGGTKDYDGIHMRRILKELVKKGMIIQYELFHFINGREVGSPFLYTLSAGGRRYLRKQGIAKHHPHLKQKFEIEQVLSLMAVNQFHIMFLQQYGLTTRIKRDDYFGECYTKAGISNCYILGHDRNDINLFLRAVRGNCGWEKDYIETLKRLKEYAAETGMKDFMLLCVCETEYQAMECFKLQYDCQEVRDMQVYYITDTSIVTEETVFSRLIEVSLVDGKCKRSTFRLEFVAAVAEKRRDNNEKK